MPEMKQSVNSAQVVGTVVELNFKEIVGKTFDLKNPKTGNKQSVTCNAIQKSDYKNPSMTIEVSLDGKEPFTVGIDFDYTMEKRINKDGMVENNPKFKALQTIMEYEPKTTRVKVNGSLKENAYVGKNGFSSFAYIGAYQCSSSGLPEEDLAEGIISGSIKSIVPETKGEDAEETGRLFVTIYAVNYLGSIEPFKLVVEEDLASDFESTYEVGDSCKLYYEILTKQVGGRKVQSSGGLGGRRESHMTSGFSVTEYSVFNGDEAFEEENEYFIDSESLATAVKAREKMIAQKEKEAEENGNSKSSGSSKSKGGLGNRASKVESVEEAVDPDCPFL